jgi:tetratricopeptide (TPR) repeat protein
MLQSKFPQAILLLVLAAGPVLAQFTQPAHSSTEPIQVTGQLRYAGGAPANEIIVRLESFTGGVVGEVRTDRSGKFRFQGLQPLQYHLVIRHPGFQEIQREVNLVMIAQEYLQLQLVPDISYRAAPPSSSRLVLDASVPSEARREFEKADEALATGKKERIEEGIRHLEKAISLYPNFLEAQLRLGAAYMDLHEWDKAEQALRRALEINPRTANAYFALGEIYWRQKKYSEAEKILREGLGIEDRSWRGHFTLGRVYWSKGDFSKAGPQVGIAIQLNPNFAEAHLLAGNILLRVNKREDALVEFQEYLRLAPKGEFAAQARTAVEKLKQQK